MISGKARSKGASPILRKAELVILRNIKRIKKINVWMILGISVLGVFLMTQSSFTYGTPKPVRYPCRRRLSNDGPLGCLCCCLSEAAKAASSVPSSRGSSNSGPSMKPQPESKIPLANKSALATGLGSLGFGCWGLYEYLGWSTEVDEKTSFQNLTDTEKRAEAVEEVFNNLMSEINGEYEGSGSPQPLDRIQLLLDNFEHWKPLLTKGDDIGLQHKKVRAVTTLMKSVIDEYFQMEYTDKRYEATLTNETDDAVETDNAVQAKDTATAADMVQADDAVDPADAVEDDNPVIDAEAAVADNAVSTGDASETTVLDAGIDLWYSDFKTFLEIVKNQKMNIADFTDIDYIFRPINKEGQNQNLELDIFDKLITKTISLFLIRDNFKIELIKNLKTEVESVLPLYSDSRRKYLYINRDIFDLVDDPNVSISRDDLIDKVLKDPNTKHDLTLRKTLATLEKYKEGRLNEEGGMISESLNEASEQEAAGEVAEAHSANPETPPKSEGVEELGSETMTEDHEDFNVELLIGQKTEIDRMGSLLLIFSVFMFAVCMVGFCISLIVMIGKTRKVKSATNYNR